MWATAAASGTRRTVVHVAHRCARAAITIGTKTTVRWEFINNEAYGSWANRTNYFNQLT
jgi:hypothetical protein